MSATPGAHDAGVDAGEVQSQRDRREDEVRQPVTGPAAARIGRRADEVAVPRDRGQSPPEPDVDTRATVPGRPAQADRDIDGTRSRRSHFLATRDQPIPAAAAEASANTSATVTSEAVTGSAWRAMRPASGPLTRSDPPGD